MNAFSDKDHVSKLANAVAVEEGCYEDVDVVEHDEGQTSLNQHVPDWPIIKAKLRLDKDLEDISPLDLGCFHQRLLTLT